MSSRLSQYVSFCTYSSGKTCISKAALERQRRDYTVYSGFCLSHRHDRDFATTFWAFGSRTRATGARRTSQAQKRGEKHLDLTASRLRRSAIPRPLTRPRTARSSETALAPVAPYAGPLLTPLLQQPAPRQSPSRSLRPPRSCGGHPQPRRGRPHGPPL